MAINLKTLLLVLPLALILTACQTVPITETSRTTFAEPPAQNGMVRVSNFHIPKDEPGTTLTHFFIGSPYLNESFGVSIFDITGETRYLGTVNAGSIRRPELYQQWLEHEFPAGKRTLMLAAGVNSIGVHHADFIEIDVKPGEASHVAISRYGFLTYPYLGEVRISAGNRKFCEALSGKPSEREKSAMAYMAANGIDPNARDFERFCRVLSNPRQILAPTEHARSLIAELKPQIEKLRAEQYAIWMREAEKRAPYDLMRSYQPVSTQESW